MFEVTRRSFLTAAASLFPLRVAVPDPTRMLALTLRYDGWDIRDIDADATPAFRVVDNFTFTFAGEFASHYGCLVTSGVMHEAVVVYLDTDDGEPDYWLRASPDLDVWASHPEPSVAWSHLDVFEDGDQPEHWGRERA